jgi:hypothetical protein
MSKVWCTPEWPEGLIFAAAGAAVISIEDVEGNEPRRGNIRLPHPGSDRSSRRAYGTATCAVSAHRLLKSMLRVGYLRHSFFSLQHATLGSGALAPNLGFLGHRVGLVAYLPARNPGMPVEVL